MLHKALMLSAMGLGSFMTSGIARAEEQELGLIELDMNLSDVEKPAELPAGLYVGEIQDVQKGTSQKGNEYFAIKFVIPNSEVPAELAEQFEDGASLFYNRLVVPNGKDRRALFNLRKFLEAIGIDANTTTIDPNEWMGRQARLKVVMGKWQGDDRAEIKSIESAEVRSAPKTAAPASPNKGRGRK